MLHACVQRFDVIENFVNFWNFGCIKTRPKFIKKTIMILWGRPFYPDTVHLGACGPIEWRGWTKRGRLHRFLQPCASPLCRLPSESMLQPSSSCRSSTLFFCSCAPRLPPSMPSMCDGRWAAPPFLRTLHATTASELCLPPSAPPWAPCHRSGGRWWWFSGEPRGSFPPLLSLPCVSARLVRSLSRSQPPPPPPIHPLGLYLRDAAVPRVSASFWVESLVTGGLVFFYWDGQGRGWD